MEIHRFQGAPRGLDIFRRYVRKQLVEQLGFDCADFSEQFAADVCQRKKRRAFVARVRARFEKPVFEQGVHGRETW